MKATVDSVRAAVRAALPVGPGVVAVGGGADSAVLAWAIPASDHPAACRLLFVDHGLGGSDLLRGSVEELARHLDLALEVVPGHVDEGPDLERRARRTRLRAFGAALRDVAWLATGHSADDQAETVLGNFLRGSGATGLGGIPGHRAGIVRPLLEFPRSGLRAIADDLLLPYVDDPANEDRRFRRVRLRHDLLPLLEREYNPALRPALGRTARLLAADDAVLTTSAGAITHRRDAGAVLIPIHVLTAVEPAVASRAIRAALRQVFAPYAGTGDDTAAVFSIARGDLERTGLSGGYLAEREGAYVAVYRGDPVVPGTQRLTVPGTVVFGAHRIRVAADRRSRLGDRRTLFLRPGAVESGAAVRGVQPGDRIDIGVGTKRVRDLLSEAQIPRRIRSAWPVVDVGGKIAAVVGVRAAAWATADSEKVTSIKNERAIW